MPKLGDMYIDYCYAKIRRDCLDYCYAKIRRDVA